MRVLLVEDDVQMAQVLSLMLRSAAATVDQVGTGEEALELARRYDYDIVILDLLLPDVEGYEVVRRMRAARVETPVLIVSGLPRSQAAVRGLLTGADDFVAKPFDKAELLARVEAVVRRSRGISTPLLHIGDVEINLASRDVHVAGVPVALTSKEYSILALLALRKGSVLAKEVVLNHLYGGLDEPEIKIVDVFICKLRKKLAAAGADRLIGTVWGEGYIIRHPPSAEPSARKSTVPKPAEPLVAG
jgi:two-component system, cell cycle response regulator CtrA